MVLVVGGAAGVALRGACVEATGKSCHKQENREVHSAPSRTHKPLPPPQPSIERAALRKPVVMARRHAMPVGNPFKGPRYEQLRVDADAELIEIAGSPRSPRSPRSRRKSPTASSLPAEARAPPSPSKAKGSPSPAAGGGAFRTPEEETLGAAGAGARICGSDRSMLAQFAETLGPRRPGPDSHGFDRVARPSARARLAGDARAPGAGSSGATGAGAARRSGRPGRRRPPCSSSACSRPTC